MQCFPILTLSLVVSILVIGKSEGANILFFHQIGSYSHRVAVWPLVEELAARGHNVTFHALFPPKSLANPNVTEFCPTGLEDIWADPVIQPDGSVVLKEYNFIDVRLKGGRVAALKDMLFFHETTTMNACETFLAHPETQDFLQNNHYDLVVIDALYNECAYGIAHKWGAKTILYYTAHPSGAWAPDPLGFLDTGETSWISDLCFPFQMPLSFSNRVVNTLIATYMNLQKEWYYYPHITELFKKYLGVEDFPSLSNLVKNTDLVFYNSHFSFDQARSLPPMFVPVPALHAWKKTGSVKKSIPQEMANFIDSTGEDGFIYVSFGSDADLSKARPEFQQIFLDVFFKSKANFVWKRSQPTEAPRKNVYTSEWMPQQEILASPKCRGFIGHGGLLGVQEALLNAVPMIVLPVFAEQEYNALRIQTSGRGILIDPVDLTRENLDNAINKILTKKSYKENNVKARSLLLDRMNSPLETAVFWTEYVLRNDDLSSLRPLKTKHHYWFQVHLLDVWTFIFSTVGFVIFSLIFILRKILNSCLRTNNSKLKLKKN